MASSGNPCRFCGIDDDGYKNCLPCLGALGCTNGVSTAVETFHFMVTTTALFIILILGATNVLSPTAFGFTVAGIAGGSFCIRLLGCDLKNRAPSLIMSGLLATLLVTLGILGGTGVLAGTALITALFVSYFVGSMIFELSGKSIIGCCRSFCGSGDKTESIDESHKNKDQPQTETPIPMDLLRSMEGGGHPWTGEEILQGLLAGQATSMRQEL